MIRMLVAALAAAVFGLACASEPEPVPEPEPVVEATPPPAPEPEPVAEVVVAEPAPPPPMQLPKTASALPLVGLVGASALGLAAALRVGRRGLLRRG
jgi:hypothetical protein